MNALFSLGYLSLEERAMGEVLFNQVCLKALRLSQGSRHVAEEFDILRKAMAERYIFNFSVFQSIPDSWALEQLFPIAPLHLLDKAPAVEATIADITCDSDGCLDKFVDLHDVKESLELHDVAEDQPYFLGIFLCGAYQEVLGTSTTSSAR